MMCYICLTMLPTNYKKVKYFQLYCYTMVSEFNDVVVSGIDVSKTSKKAIVALEGGGLGAGWYKITNNNESSFLAMVAVLNAAIVGNKKVTVVFSGSFSGTPPSNKEIDQVIMPG